MSRENNAFESISLKALSSWERKWVPSLFSFFMCVVFVFKRVLSFFFFPTLRYPLAGFDSCCRVISCTVFFFFSLLYFNGKDQARDSFNVSQVNCCYFCLVIGLYHVLLCRGSIISTCSSILFFLVQSLRFHVIVGDRIGKYIDQVLRGVMSKRN